MRKSIKKKLGTLRSKIGLSRSPSPMPPGESQGTGSQSHRWNRGEVLSRETVSDPNIAPTPQPEEAVHSSSRASIPATMRSKEINTNVSPPEISTWDVTKGAMMTALRMTKEASGACPPLQAAVGALIPLVEIIQVVSNPWTRLSSGLSAFFHPQKYSSNRDALQALYGHIDEFNRLIRSASPQNVNDSPQEESFKQ